MTYKLKALAMWTHYCCAEHEDISVGKNEECNWCGLTEQSQDKKESEECSTLSQPF